MTSNFRKDQIARKRRSMRVRKFVRGTAEKPRMSVVKSCKHISVQLIDDENGVTLAHLSTNAKDLQSLKLKRNKAAAKLLGSKIAEKAKVLGTTTCVFDRGPFKYHGILAELADAARAGGLQF
jgi:large subunit ribosomal protein L18